MLPSPRPFGASMPPGAVSTVTSPCGSTARTAASSGLPAGSGTASRTRMTMRLTPPLMKGRRPGQVDAADRVAHRPHRRLGRVLPLQVDAHAELDQHHLPHRRLRRLLKLTDDRLTE